MCQSAERRSGLVVLAQRTNPDVSEADGISVLVKLDIPFRRMRIIVIAHHTVIDEAPKLAAVMDRGAPRTWGLGVLALMVAAFTSAVWVLVFRTA